MVLYSSHSDPGEGEHKIMSFIRYLCTSPDYNASERHCIYGLDADLILLSLSLHDVNVILLRNIIDFRAYFRKVQTPINRSESIVPLCLLSLTPSTNGRSSTSPFCASTSSAT